MYKSEHEVRTIIALGKPVEVVDMFLESYLQGIEYAKWCEGKDLDEVVETTVTDEEGVEITTSALVNVYEPLDVTEAMAQWKLSNYVILRKAEYPLISDYVDAMVKGDEVGMADYVSKCLAVKAKYPK